MDEEINELDEGYKDKNFVVLNKWLDTKKICYIVL